MSDKQTEKISDKKMYWRIAGTAWVFFFLFSLMALFEKQSMVGWKAGIFIGGFLILALAFSYIADRKKEEDPPDTSEG